MNEEERQLLDKFKQYEEGSIDESMNPWRTSELDAETLDGPSNAQEEELLRYFEGLDLYDSEGISLNELLTAREKIEMVKSFQFGEGETGAENYAQGGPFGMAEHSKGRHAMVLDTGDKRYKKQGFAIEDDFGQPSLDAINRGEHPTINPANFKQPWELEDIERGGVYVRGAAHADPVVWNHEYRHHLLTGGEKEVRETLKEAGVHAKGDFAREEMYIRLFDIYRGLNDTDPLRINNLMVDTANRANDMAQMEGKERPFNSLEEVVDMIDDVAPRLAEQEARYYLQYIGIPEEDQPASFTKEELKDRTDYYLGEWKDRLSRFIDPRER